MRKRDIRPEVEVVAQGYDALASRYGAWAAAVVDGTREAWVGRLIESLHADAGILDLGCGNGMPTAQQLANSFRVTGIDVSPAQIEAARVAVPSARFLVADMLEADFPPASFDAVIALYSLIHVPTAALPGLLRRIHEWLVPGGLFLAVLGTVPGEGVEDDWLGVPMFFAGQAPTRNRELVRGAGFELVAEDVVTIVEPDHGNVAFHWLQARRPA